MKKSENFYTLRFDNFSSYSVAFCSEVAKLEFYIVVSLLKTTALKKKYRHGQQIFTLI